MIDIVVYYCFVPHNKLSLDRERNVRASPDSFFFLFLNSRTDEFTIAVNPSMKGMYRDFFVCVSMTLSFWYVGPKHWFDPSQWYYLPRRWYPNKKSNSNPFTTLIYATGFLSELRHSTFDGHIPSFMRCSCFGNGAKIEGLIITPQ